MGLGDNIPVYVTRKNADGSVGTIYYAAWFVLLIQLLLMANLIGWGCYGIAQLVDKVV